MIKLLEKDKFGTFDDELDKYKEFIKYKARCVVKALQSVALDVEWFTGDEVKSASLEDAKHVLECLEEMHNMSLSIDEYAQSNLMEE